MQSTTLITLVIAGVATALLIVAHATLPVSRTKLRLFLKALAVIVVICAALSTVFTETEFYRARPQLAVYVGSPVAFGLIWNLVRQELNRPGSLAAIPRRLMALMSGSRYAPKRYGREPRRVEKYSAGLKGWLSLVLFEDKPFMRVVHIAMLTSGLLTALLLPAPHGWWVPFVFASVSAVRWWRIERERKAIIQRVYSIAAPNLDYRSAVSNKLDAKAGARFAFPNAAVRVDWEDLTTPSRLQIGFPISFSKSDLGKRKHFENEFDQTIPGLGWRYDWDTHGQTISVTVADYPTDVRWAGAVAPKWSEFFVGENLDTGNRIIFDVDNESPHILVAGETKTGKSEAMFTIAAQALVKGWQVAICDPKETGWASWTRNFRRSDNPEPGLGSLPLRPGDSRDGVVEHAVELFGIRDVLVRMTEELKRRKAVMSKARVVKWSLLSDEIKKEHNFVPFLLIVDEALSLFNTEKGGAEDAKMRNDVRNEALSKLTNLVVEARALGIHIMLGIQRPDAAILGGAMRDNIGARIACGQMATNGLGMMFDNQETPRLPVINPKTGKNVPGRAMVRAVSGAKVQTMQTMWLGENAVDLDDAVPLPPDADFDNDLSFASTVNADSDDATAFIENANAALQTAAPYAETHQSTPPPPTPVKQEPKKKRRGVDLTEFGRGDMFGASTPAHDSETGGWGPSSPIDGFNQHNTVPPLDSPDALSSWGPTQPSIPPWEEIPAATPQPAPLPATQAPPPSEPTTPIRHRTEPGLPVTPSPIPTAGTWGPIQVLPYATTVTDPAPHEDDEDLW